MNPIDGGNIFEEKSNIYEIEFDSNKYGYEILGMTKFLIIPVVQCSNIEIIIEFIVNNSFNLYNSNIILDDNQNMITNIFDDFWIQLDRVVLDSKIRSKIVQFTHDYEEYPIIDICEYFPEKKIIQPKNNIPQILNLLNPPNPFNQFNPFNQLQYNLDDNLDTNLDNNLNDNLNDNLDDNLDNNLNNNLNDNFDDNLDDNLDDKLDDNFKEFIKYKPSNPYILLSSIIIGTISIYWLLKNR
jgi:hypothetical protein